MKSRGLILLGVALLTAGCHLPRWPVEAPMTSGVGLRMMGWRPDVHRGVDFDVDIGTPIMAMAAGEVRFAGVQRGYGNVIWLDHGGSVLSVYAHLSEIHVQEGQEVGPRQVIGLSGDTGEVTGPHLHFEVWRGGKPVDPIQMLGGRPKY